MKKVVVIALGGNAILQRGQQGTFDEQLANVHHTCEQLVKMVLSGKWKLVVTHGNGPQVGNILIQNDAGKASVPPMPMDVCGSYSQGMIGYMFQLSFRNLLDRQGRKDIPVATVVTQVLVDKDDPAFANPTKPVGPFYSEEQAKLLERTKGFCVREDAGRGWRRVVPSPDPKQIVEQDAIRSLVDSQVIVVSTGGGGIPVIQENGELRGVEAVIDKDLAGQRLARDVNASVFLMLTDVDAAHINFGQPDEQKLGRITVEKAKQYMEEGHFAEGSMAPKVLAGIRFVEGGGERAIIASLEQATKALAGAAGTQIVRDSHHQV